MTSLSYIQLKNLRDNSQLVVGEEYSVSDFPTFHPIVEATATNQLSPCGRTTEGYKLLYSLDCDNPTPPADFKGQIIYLSNGNISAYYDWINEHNIRNSANVRIGPTYDSNGYRVAYGGLLIQCHDITINGNNGVFMGGCGNIIIGTGNIGQLTNSNYVTIGNNNTSLALTNVLGCKIGNGNANLTLTGEDIEIGDSNDTLTLTVGGGTIGSGNRYVEINADEFEVGRDCLKVIISDKFNKVDKTHYADLKSPYNEVSDSNSIELEGSAGNKVESSRLVYLKNVNNGDLFVSEYSVDQDTYNTPDPEPFVRVRPNNQERALKIATSMIDNIKQQTDNTGIVIDKNTENRLSKGISSRYYILDGRWVSEDTAPETAYVQISMSKTQSRHAQVTGWGEYQIGTTVTVDYSWLEPGYTGTFYDQDGNQHAAPYSFILDGDCTVYVSLTV